MGGSTYPWKGEGVRSLKALVLLKKRIEVLESVHKGRLADTCSIPVPPDATKTGSSASCASVTEPPPPTEPEKRKAEGGKQRLRLLW